MLYSIQSVHYCVKNLAQFEAIAETLAETLAEHSVHGRRQSHLLIIWDEQAQ